MAKKHFRSIDVDASESPVIPDAVAASIDRTFLLSGRAFFTVKNPVGKSFTYKVHRRIVGEGRHAGDPSYFVRMLNRSDAAGITAADAVERWPYIGVLLKDGTIEVTGRSTTYAAGSPEFDVAQWAIKTVFANESLPVGYSITHMGKCGVCGQVLSNMLDKESGIHQTCLPKRWE